MKIVFWKQCIARLLVACGVALPATAWAAPLNTNLVLNPSFEDIDLGDEGPFLSGRIFDWDDFDGDDDDTFAYAYSQNYSGNPAPPDAEEFHYTGGFATEPGQPQIYQFIDLDTGPSADQIASGNAAYNLSAFFSTYRTQGDASRIRAIFWDNSDEELAQVDIGGAEFVASLPLTDGQRDWGQDVGVGLIPASTAYVEIQVISEFGGANHDGYIDLVDFQVNDQVRLPALDLTVDRGGLISIQNQTGEPVDFSGYTVASEHGALDFGSWTSVADAYDVDGDQTVDDANQWTKLADDDYHDLSEADLDSGFGTVLAPGQTIELGRVWIGTPIEDVTFRYLSGDEEVSGLVAFTGNDGAALTFGDLNRDATIDVEDWEIFRAGLHRQSDTTSTALAYIHGDLNGDLVTNHADFVLFQSVYDAANGEGALAALVPEPTSVSVVWVAALPWLIRRRNR